MATNAAKMLDGAREVLWLDVVDDVALAQVREYSAQATHPLQVPGRLAHNLFIDAIILIQKILKF